MIIRGTGDAKSLHQIAFDYINTHGKDLKGEPLGKYFTHGLGHHVGLDVHDPWMPDKELAEGHVINPIRVPDAVKRDARTALDRMLALSGTGAIAHTD